MLNEYNNYQKVEIKPACTGILQKSHPKSFFTYCHAKSEYRKYHIDNNRHVLQVMVFGDEYIIVEMFPDDVCQEWVNAKKEKSK